MRQPKQRIAPQGLDLKDQVISINRVTPEAPVIVLADTSAWIALWRQGNAPLAALLERNQVGLHPFVLGEIALGRITPRAEVLRRLRRLRVPSVARDSEVLALIERVPLWGRGIGWVDAHLLASAILDRLRLLTLDHRLAQVAQDLDVAFTR